MHEPLMNTFENYERTKGKLNRAKKHFNQVDQVRENKPAYVGSFGEGKVSNVRGRFEDFRRLFDFSAFVRVVTGSEKARDSARCRRENGSRAWNFNQCSEKTRLERSIHVSERHLLPKLKFEADKMCGWSRTTCNKRYRKTWIIE